METAITLTHLDIGYRHKKQTHIIVENLNLSLYKGELVCLLGINGAGKSTLIRTITGLHTALKGEVWIGDKRINDLKKQEIAQKISLVLTEKPASPKLTVYELVALGRFPYTDWADQLTETDRYKINKAIASVEIQPLVYRQIRTLSDGQLQKVMIARALAQDSDLIILDEPTAHLDLLNRSEIIALLRRIAISHQKAILISTHELDWAMLSAHKIWLISPQKTIISGTPEDLVLNHHLQDVFEHKNIFFDIHDGFFKLRNATQGVPVYLEAAMPEYYWTKRILEKENFTIHSTPNEAIIQVNVHKKNEKLCWIVNKEIECYSLENLIVQLKSGVVYLDKK